MRLAAIRRRSGEGVAAGVLIYLPGALGQGCGIEQPAEVGGAGGGEWLAVGIQAQGLAEGVEKAVERATRGGGRRLPYLGH